MQRPPCEVPCNTEHSALRSEHASAWNGDFMVGNASEPGTGPHTHSTLLLQINSTSRSHVSLTGGMVCICSNLGCLPCTAPESSPIFRYVSSELLYALPHKTPKFRHCIPYPHATLLSCSKIVHVRVIRGRKIFSTNTFLCSLTYVHKALILLQPAQAFVPTVVTSPDNTHVANPYISLTVKNAATGLRTT